MIACGGDANGSIGFAAAKDDVAVWDQSWVRGTGGKYQPTRSRLKIVNDKRNVTSRSIWRDGLVGNGGNGWWRVTRTVWIKVHRGCR